MPFLSACGQSITHPEFIILPEHSQQFKHIPASATYTHLQRQNKCIIIKTVRDKHIIARLHWVSAIRMGVANWRKYP